MQVLEEAVLSDLVYGVVNCPADQFGALCACFPPQLFDLLDLLPDELNLRFLHHAPPLFGYSVLQLDRGHYRWSPDGCKCHKSPLGALWTNHVGPGPFTIGNNEWQSMALRTLVETQKRF